MGFKDNLISNLTNKIGNSASRIENVDGRGAMPTTVQELKEGREHAKAIVKRKSLMSSIVNVVPIPGLDFGVDLELVKDIVEDVNKIYGLDHEQANSLEDDVKERIMSAVAIRGSQFIDERIPNTFLRIVIRDVAKRITAKQTK